MDKITIVKVGGKIINEKDLLSDFLVEFSKIKGKKILVHGGGKSASEMLLKLGIEPRMHDGRRITDATSLEVCVGQYAGNINKQIVASLQAIDVDAIGLSGADGGIIKAEKRPAKPFDYGFAGDIKFIEKDKILGLLQLDLVPVFCAITADQRGQLLNTNADTIASSVAISLIGEAKVDLRFCFEYEGVLEDLNSKSVFASINRTEFQALINDNILNGGILPKLHNAIAAKNNGVELVSICGSTNLLALNNSTKIL